MFDELHCLRIALSFAILLLPATANSWDLAVTVGKNIDFLSNNGSLINRIQIPEAIALSALTYDSTINTAYFSSIEGNSSSILSLDLNYNNNTPKSLLTRQNGSHISSMMYHAESTSLFWTDVFHHSVMKMPISKSGQPLDQIELHRHQQHIPRGISIDVCNRHLYWTNNYLTTGNATIERSRLDGSNRVTIIDRDLYEPVGITVDNEDQKLYWVDDKEGIYYQIERSNFDGTNRETIFHGKHQQPIFIVTDRDNIYWTDYASKYLMVLGKKSNKPRVLKSYVDDDSRPLSVITRKAIECKDSSTFDVISADKRENQSYNVQKLTYQLTPLIKDAFQRKSENCSNNGYYDATNNKCRCELGFIGIKCEISACHNYCLEGECTVRNDGSPECQCSDAYDGLRCERKKCNGYCLNEGQCYIENGQPKCKCKYLNTSRCENSGADFVQFCTLFCMSEQAKFNQTYVTLCRCIEKEQVFQEVLGYAGLLDCDVLVPFLGVLIAILSVIIGVLSFYVNKLKRRPRIKRRYVVNRTGVTPLTSRPQLSGEQCEITIENCCNMNICETPCFEPKLRNAMPTNLKKEEKNCLLDNMENNIF